MVDAVARRFLAPDERNDIYGLVTAIFDAPWGSHDRACLISEQSSIKLDILLYDIDGDIPDDVPDEQRTRGFFAAKDTYLRIASNPDNRTVPTSACCCTSMHRSWPRPMDPPGR